MSARKTMLDTIIALAKKVRSGAYWVHRGPVNWATFDYGNRPRGIAVRFEDGQFLAPHAMNEATLGIDLFTAWDDDPGNPDVDDGLIDELIDDATEIVEALGRATDAQGDAVVFRIARTTARVMEVSDADLGVLGVIVQFNVTY